MEHREFATKFNSLIVAGNIIASYQKGELLDDKIIHSVLTKTYDLSNGRKGDILCLAIELQKFVAAIQLMDYNTISSDEEVVESLNTSLENFNGEEDLRLLEKEGKNDLLHERLIVEKTANLKALKLLKERYLGNQRVR